MIDEPDGGPVFRAAVALTEKLVAAVLDPERLDLEGLEERYRFRGPEQTLVVVCQQAIVKFHARPHAGIQRGLDHQQIIVADRRFIAAEGF